MSEKNVAQILESSGMPVVYRAWEALAPALPWIAYLYEGSNNLYADGVVYEKIGNWRTELYTETKDLSSEEHLENALAQAGITWVCRGTVWIESEHMYMTIYEFEV